MCVVGGFLTAAVTVWTDGGSPPVIEDGTTWTLYRYLAGEFTEQYDIPGETSQTLVVPYEAVGWRIQFIANAHNGDGSSTAFGTFMGMEDSPITEIAANVPPLSNRLPARSRRTSW
jgi:hypothetical protein